MLLDALIFAHFCSCTLYHRVSQALCGLSPSRRGCFATQDFH
jgi:hypothetical protein